MYNKRQFKKTNDKKVLHKIGKSWKVISLSLLMAIGGTAAVTHANADTTDANTANANNNQTEAHLNANQMSANHSVLVKPQQSASASSNTNQSANNSLNSSNVARPVSLANISNANSNNVSLKAESIANHVVGNAFNENNTSSAYSLASSYADDLFDINDNYITTGLDSALPKDENILGDTINTGWTLESGNSSISIDELNSICNEYSDAVSKVTTDVTNMNPSWKYTKVNDYYNVTKSANLNIQTAYENLNPRIYMNTPTDGGIMNITRDMISTGYIRSCVKNDLDASPITLNNITNASTFADEASNTAASADAVINSDKASYSASVARHSASNPANSLALASAYSRDYNSMYSAYAYINNDYEVTNSYSNKFYLSAVAMFSDTIPRFKNSMKRLSNYHNISQMNRYASSVDAKYTHFASGVVSYANSEIYRNNSLAYSASYSVSYANSVNASYNASYSASVSASYANSSANVHVENDNSVVSRYIGNYHPILNKSENARISADNAALNSSFNLSDASERVSRANRDLSDIMNVVYYPIYEHRFDWSNPSVPIKLVNASFQTVSKAPYSNKLIPATDSEYSLDWTWHTDRNSNTKSVLPKGVEGIWAAYEGSRDNSDYDISGIAPNAYHISNAYLNVSQGIPAFFEYADGSVKMMTPSQMGMRKYTNIYTLR